MKYYEKVDDCQLLQVKYDALVGQKSELVSREEGESSILVPPDPTTPNEGGHTCENVVEIDSSDDGCPGPKQKSSSNIGNLIKEYGRLLKPSRALRNPYEAQKKSKIVMKIIYQLERFTNEHEWLQRHLFYEVDMDAMECVNHWLTTVEKGYLVVPRISFQVLKENVDKVLANDWLDTPVVSAYTLMLEKKLKGLRDKRTCIVNPMFGARISLNINNLEHHKSNLMDVLPSADLLRRRSKFFISVCVDYHWMMLVADHKDKCFYWFNSMESKRCHSLAKKMASWWCENIMDCREDSCNIIIHSDLPQQANGVDCGVYMLAFMVAFAISEKIIPFRMEDIPMMRQRIALDLSAGYLLP